MIECKGDRESTSADCLIHTGLLVNKLLGFGGGLELGIPPESNKTTSSSGYNSYYEQVESFDHYLLNVRSLSRESEQSGPKYQHHWPDIRFGWRIIVGSVVGFFGAACGSVGGVGGGGIYVPMLTIIIGFDAKSAVPISKCMITGAALSTVYYNLKRRHPTLDMPVIDYHLTLLMQPILMLGISVGVILSEIFADWMVTILLIILFLAISMLSFLKGVETWKKETKFKKVMEMKTIINKVINQEIALSQK